MSRRMKCVLVEALASVPDPRRQCKNLRHRLVDVLVVGFCGVLCGCEDFVDIEKFAEAKEDFFQEFLELPGGIPSHDTFRRVFQAVSPQALQAGLLAWLGNVREAAGIEPGSGQKLIAVDGKSLRRTFDRGKELGALHVVSAWASEQGVTLGQVAVDDKSNEITAIPELLKLLDLKDCVVTIDAAGCQKDIAKQIIEQGGDYVLALKANQPTLEQQVADYFEQQLEVDRCDSKVRQQRSHETGHGRDEKRECLVAPVPAELVGQAEWTGLQSIAMVVRETTDHARPETTGEVRLFISSLKPKVKVMAKAIRQHWGIENGLHWVLDVAFNEDRLRVRDRNAANNLALLNRLAVSILKQDRSVKAGVKCKRKAAGWDNDYLRQLLTICP